MPPTFQKRCFKDTAEFKSDLPEFAKSIYVNEADMKNVYFLISGPTDSPFQGGEYVIHLELTEKYPMEPPSFRMLTPNGRFILGSKICTSFSNFHKESWSPCYNFNTIIKSLISFMLDTDTSHVGAMQSSTEEKVRYAMSSHEYNKTKGYDKWFV